MDLQNFLPALDIRDRHNHLTVKTARPEQGRVQDIGPVCGRNQDDPFIRFKTIHFNEQLIQRLFPLIMASTQARSPVPSNGIDFIDEDDAGALRFP